MARYFLIPVSNTASQTFECPLGNAGAARFNIWRQPSDGGWYLSVFHPPGSPVVEGRRIVVRESLLRPVDSKALRGRLICERLGPLPEAPGEAPWGFTHGLYWVEE